MLKLGILLGTLMVNDSSGNSGYDKWKEQLDLLRSLDNPEQIEVPQTTVDSASEFLDIFDINEGNTAKFAENDKQINLERSKELADIVKKYTGDKPKISDAYRDREQWESMFQERLDKKGLKKYEQAFREGKDIVKARLDAYEKQLGRKLSNKEKEEAARDMKKLSSVFNLDPEKGHGAFRKLDLASNQFKSLNKKQRLNLIKDLEKAGFSTRGFGKGYSHLDVDLGVPAQQRSYQSVDNYVMAPVSKLKNNESMKEESMIGKEENKESLQDLFKKYAGEDTTPTISDEELRAQEEQEALIEQQMGMGAEVKRDPFEVPEESKEGRDPASESEEKEKEKPTLEDLLAQVREIGSDRKRQNTINAIGQIAAGLSNAAYGQAGQGGYGFAGGPIKAQKIDVGSDDRLKDILKQYKMLGGGKDGTKRFQTSSGIVEVDKEGNIKELYRDPYRMGRLEQGERRVGQSEERLKLQKEKQDWRKQEKNELSDAQIESINNVDKTLDKLDKLEGMKKEFSTGPLTGRINNIARYLGQADGNKTAMAAQIGDILSEYAKSISGSAIAEEEFQRLAEQLPKETDSDEQFAAKLARFKDNMEDSRLRVLDNYKRQGKNIENLKERRSIEDLREEYKPEEQEQSVVRRKTKDERVALFDAETKKFIKYEDE